MIKIQREQLANASVEARPIQDNLGMFSQGTGMLGPFNPPSQGFVFSRASIDMPKNKKKVSKKKNPQDATLRNIRALKARVKSLEEVVARIQTRLLLS